MGSLPLSSMVQGAAGTLQVVMGIWNRIKAKRTLEEAKGLITDAPKYTRQGELAEIEALYKQQMRGEAPGYGLEQERIGARGAESLRQMRAGVSSPQAYAQAVQGVQQRSLDAERDLYTRGLQWQEAGRQGLVQSKYMGAQEGRREWYYNQMLPNERMLNLLANQYNTQSTQGSTDIRTGISTLVGSAGGIKGADIQWPGK